MRRSSRNLIESPDILTAYTRRPGRRPDASQPIIPRLFVASAFRSEGQRFLRRICMSRSTRRRVGFAAVVVSLAAVLLALVFAPGVLQAQRGATPADGYLTGVVQGPSGPEAGVW